MKIVNLIYYLIVIWTLVLELTSGIFLYNYFTAAVLAGYLLNGISAAVLVLFLALGKNTNTSNYGDYYHVLTMHLFWRVAFQTSVAYIITLDSKSGAPYHYIILGLPELVAAIAYVVYKKREKFLGVCNSSIGSQGYSSLV